jgi:phosphoribosyl 1,2-cyclic phosphodiesterase
MTLNIKTIATGSTGNCYFIRHQDELKGLLIEAGIPLKKILGAFDYDIHGNIEACLISHEHQDHSGSLDALRRQGVACHDNSKADPISKDITLGAYTVKAFKLQHDAKSHVGFLIRSHSARLLYITDTAQIPYKFPGLTHIMIECNFEKDLLEQNVTIGKVHPMVALRIIRNHFELVNVTKYLHSCDLSKVQEIRLIHPSTDNLDLSFAKEYISRAIEQTVS